MVIKEKEVLAIIDQVQKSVQNKEVPLEEVPMNDLMNLLEATLGGTFWKGIGATPQESFGTIPLRYKNLLEHCQENKDSEGFTLVLELLKNQYKCTYAILSKEELHRRTQKYKAFVYNIGNAVSSIEYWLHKGKQKSEGTHPISFGREKKGAVYTCLVGNNLTLYQPEYINVHLDYICFTDKEEKWGSKAGVWEYRQIEKTDENESVSAMYYRYKIKPHEVLAKYDYSIWVNAQIQIVGEMEQLYETYGEEASFLAFPAYVQDDLYEAVHTTLSTDDENIELRRKMFRYHEEGFPKHFGLISTNVMYRNHRDEVLNRVMNTWWEESENCQQLREFGFSYAAWKNELNYSLCDLFAEWNPYIKNVSLELEVGE